MYAAFPRSEYYGGAGLPAPSAGIAPIPHGIPGRDTSSGTGRGRFPRPLSSGRRVRHPALPLRHRHGYAVDIHRGLPTQTGKTRARTHRDAGTHRKPAFIHESELAYREEAQQHRFLAYTFPSRSPPDLSGSAGPARLCRGCSPLPRRSPGSGCLQLHPTATTAGRWRSFTPIRTTAPSWRTTHR